MPLTLTLPGLLGCVHLVDVGSGHLHTTVGIAHCGLTSGTYNVELHVYMMLLVFKFKQSG